MRILKLFVIAFFAPVLALSFWLTPTAKSQSGPTEAPAGFDNMTNHFEDQGTDPTVPGTFVGDKTVFEKRDTPETGLGPVYNAQSCAECHQNPVTGGISQIFELRAGHAMPDGTINGIFIDAPGGSLIQARAVNAEIQERVPDGSRIICSKNADQIFVMGFDGGQYGEVNNDPTGVNFASFSFDSKKILFSKAVSGIKQIFVMDVDGTNVTQLTSSSTASSIHAVWSPDGQTIAFANNSAGGFQIWTMNPDGSNPTNITNDGVGGNDFPTWSPDSQQIAFQRQNGAKTDVWIMGADGSGQTNITNTTGFNFNGNPSWSPGGKWIAFASTRDGNSEIYAIRYNGTFLTRLTNNPANDGAPAWSPDDTTIAFQSTRSGGSFRIFTMATNGNNQTMLVKQGFASYTNPQWSPDFGENIRTFRSSLNLLGDGFVEATDDSTLLAIRDGQPLGMRGTAISVPLLEASGQERIGRFGWKDSIPSLLTFSAVAYKGEVGVTSPLQPTESSSLGRSVFAFDLVMPDPEDDGGAQGFGADVEAFTRFMRSLKAPPRDRNLVPNDATDPGSALFDTLSCSVCHVRSITTTPVPGTVLNGGTFTVPDALANKTFHPFGDFLLHDIGTGDGIVETNGELTRNMVRTAPLWGVRTRDRLMHDGGSSSPPTNNGAQSFTLNEAILRHGGQAAASRTAFQALTDMQKSQLFKFLKSL
ncbi:MAG TPA: di-heme oxidoredictase family protein [Pyrinomonadaceae bacterium]|jgi:Tol biopolymer transport system component